ncbi:hypothetical protein CSAL01_10925 [Colletotrichum salicis]|uniref:Uncharacterized protein n=1 Tax=Colletotrichum salicis TaxID=1209931 RepID=A0A135UYT8_9PEZI|nr:hypothetical protein CSAL01_10925 [Colletotrichum salicis]
MQQSIDSAFSNASYIYPYMAAKKWVPAQLSESNFSFPDLILTSNLSFHTALAVLLLGAGNLTSDCTLATSWYYSHNLQSSDYANLSIDYLFYEQDAAFLHLATPKLVDAFSSWMSKLSNKRSDTIDSLILYELLANATIFGGDVVLNITRPAIEFHCLSKELAEAYSWEPPEYCRAEMNQWLPPGFEGVDALVDIHDAFAALPEEHKNISVQTFSSWYQNVTVGIHVSMATVRLERSVNNGLLLLRMAVEGGGCGQSLQSLRSVTAVDDIYTRKKQCYQTVCSELQNSGNPDIAGIGKFISYIIEAILATFIIIHTCWHNWIYRNTPLQSLRDEKIHSGFIKVINAFLNTGIVLLLSMAVALLAVGSREIIFYNGVVTHMACFFAASAVIAVASVPRHGYSRDPIFWAILLFSTIMATISMNVAGQIIIFSDPLNFNSSVESLIPFDAQESLMLRILSVPYQNYSTALVNVFMGLICFSKWRNIQADTMGAYYMEAAVGYGQVLSLFMWVPVVGLFLQLAAKRMPKVVKDCTSPKPSSLAPSTVVPSLEQLPSPSSTGAGRSSSRGS